MKAKRPKLSEFHHGRQLFHVSVGPNREGTALETHLREGMCISRPYNARLYRDEVSLFIRAIDTDNISKWRTTHDWGYSLKDSNVIWNNRNLHRMFTKRKHAERYITRINAGCLNTAERKHFAISLDLGRAY